MDVWREPLLLVPSEGLHVVLSKQIVNDFEAKRADFCLCNIVIRPHTSKTDPTT